MNRAGTQDPGAVHRMRVAPALTLGTWMHDGMQSMGAIRWVGFDGDDTLGKSED